MHVKGIFIGLKMESHLFTQAEGKHLIEQEEIDGELDGSEEAIIREGKGVRARTSTTSSIASVIVSGLNHVVAPIAKKA